MAFSSRMACAGVLAILAAGAASAADYGVEKLVEGSAFHGVHGLAVDQEGWLFAGSVTGQALYRVDTRTGAVSTEVGLPKGMADDIAVAPDGTMAWTAFLSGDVHARKGDGPVMTLASGLPGINSLGYRSDGRLYATQVFLGDALYEIDTEGKAPPRKIIEGMGGLNGFQFGPDDKLYGPLWFKGQVVRVDVDTGTIEIVAEGFKIPAAVNLDSRGNIWVVDTALGHLIRVNPKTGAKKIVARLSTSLDNLAIDDRDRIYVSNMADNGIQRINPRTGSVRQLVKGKLAMPAGLAIASDGSRETLYLADVFAYRSVNARSGRVRDLARMQADELEYPMSASANAEHVILSSWFTGTVQVLDRKSGESLSMMHDFAAPQDAIELADGGILVAELGTGNLVKASGDHGDTRVVVASGLITPVGMAMADEDSVFVTESAAGLISRVDLASGERTVIASGLQMPEGIDMLPDGKLAVAETGAQRLISVDPETGAVRSIALDLPIGLPSIPGLPPSNIPTGVAVGKDGSIYMTSDLENAIYKLTPR